MYKVTSFNSDAALQDYLNGVVLGTPLAAKVLGLHGKTLKITVSASTKTVTFSDASNAGLTPPQILKAILDTSGLASAVELRNYGYQNPANPQLVVVGEGNVLVGNGTANELLGLPTADTTVTPVTQTDIVSLTINPIGPLFVLLTNA